MSAKTPDSISYGAGTFNPYAAVAGIAVAAVTRIARGNQPREYRIGKQRVSARDFVRTIPVAFPLQKWMVAPGVRRDVRAGNVVQGSTPPTDAEWERRREAAGYYSKKKPPAGAAPPKKPPPPGQTPADRPMPGGGGRPGGPLITKAVRTFMIAWLKGAGVTVAAGVAVQYLFDLWQKTFPGRPLPTEPPPPRYTYDRAPGSQGGKGTNKPQLPPEIVFSPTIVVNVPPQPTSSTKETRETAVLIPPAPKTAPAPAAKSPVLPAPAPAPVKARSPYPSWLPTAAGVVLPLLLPQSQKRSKPRGLTGGSEPALQFDSGVAAVPFSSVGSYLDSGPSPSRTKDCRCPPKRKRGPKKKRTVCYAGSYTEKASGLRKTKRKKIPCQ